MFNVNRFLSNNYFNVIISLLAINSSSCNELAWNIIALSSAYEITFPVIGDLKILSTHKMNRRGTKMVPCGIPNIGTYLL